MREFLSVIRVLTITRLVRFPKPMTPTRANLRANSCEVAVIGAGPYGLSVAAHLKAAGVETLVLGEPMAFWRRHMPKGMMLRSPWRATHISSPSGALSLDAYAAAHGIAADRLLPLEDFVGYGEWFQRHAVPDVDRRAVRTIEATTDGFRLTLDDGDALSAGRVVVATGLRHQEFRPETFRDLPAELVSHSSEHTGFEKFRGKRIGVIGRGQSACESAALLAEAGAEVELISRGDIHWLGAAAPGVGRTAMRLRQLLKSPSEVGPFPLSWLAEAPGLVRFLSEELREEFSRRCLKAAAAGWLHARFGEVARRPGCTIIGARAVANRVALDLDGGEASFDHVILGTGYRVDLSRLGILAPQLLQRISSLQGSPLLRAGFESSVPKLHFVGSYAVRSFGPLLRFIAGAPFAARAVTTAARRGVAHERVAAFGPGMALRDAAVAQPWPPQ
jgi:cation diffusion facilitator CzcD-associated flavoprotein CzcO